MLGLGEGLKPPQSVQIHKEQIGSKTAVNDTTTAVDISSLTDQIDKIFMMTGTVRQNEGSYVQYPIVVSYRPGSKYHVVQVHTHSDTHVGMGIGMENSYEPDLLTEVNRCNIMLLYPLNDVLVDGATYFNSRHTAQQSREW